MIELKPEEKKLIELIRQTEFGELTITLRIGKPVMVKAGFKLIKLED
jgi:hypothetical protein